MYEAQGKIKVIFDEQSFASGFTKREFVITTEHERYPQDIKFELVKEKCGLIQPFEAGQQVSVNFDIRGNEYNGKYFVNLSAWKIQAADGSAPAPARAAAAPATARPSNEPSASDLRVDHDFDDDDIAPF